MQFPLKGCQVQWEWRLGATFLPIVQVIYAAFYREMKTGHSFWPLSNRGKNKAWGDPQNYIGASEQSFWTVQFKWGAPEITGIKQDWIMLPHVFHQSIFQRKNMFFKKYSLFGQCLSKSKRIKDRGKRKQDVQYLCSQLCLCVLWWWRGGLHSLPRTILKKKKRSRRITKWAGFAVLKNPYFFLNDWDTQYVHSFVRILNIRKNSDRWTKWNGAH